MTYKLVVKEIANNHGVYASFMPKPITDKPGSSMHVHQSLSDFDGKNLFYDANDPQDFCLSDIAKHYLAGILKYAPEFCLVTNQYVNSYKRLVARGEVPAHISWSRSNRSTLVRIPGYRPHRGEACRIELRSPDPGANPYLAFAAILAAGLAGIEEGLALPDPVDNCNLFESQTVPEAKLTLLPTNLGEAVENFAASKLMRETLGEHIHSYLVESKRAEWMAYLRHVSDWELERYLGVL